jgi:hypothetical protein
MPTQNTVTVIHGAGVASSLPLPLTWNPATNWRTDQCVTVTDSAVGFLGSRCADPVAVTTFRYRYTRMVGPYEAPGDFLVENTATFVTNNSGATGSSSATVSVSVR